MAVEITPLGFKKPDGNDPIRDGNDHISTNAQKAQELLADTRGRLKAVESAAFSAGALQILEDPADPGYYLIGG